MSEWIRKINWKYVVVMLIGNIILGLGIAIFKLSGLGNDPFSGMVMALAECVGIEYARFLILLNLGFFVIEIIWGRKAHGRKRMQQQGDKERGKDAQPESSASAKRADRV